MSVSVFNSHKRQTLRRDVAEQLGFPVASPCRGICQSDERGFVGAVCAAATNGLTGKMSDVEKQNVLRLCRQRFLRKIRANKPLPSEDPQQPSLF